MTGLAIALSLAGCHRAKLAAIPAVDPWTPRPGADLGAEVARVGAHPIYAAEVTAESASSNLPPARAVERLIDLELLAERARAHGFDRKGARDDKDAGALSERRLMVQRLLQRELESKLRPEDVPEEDLRKIYQQNDVKFVHPRLVEVALLSVYTGPNMKPAPRVRAGETARALFDYVSRRPLHTPEDFATIAQEKQWTDRRVGYWRLVQGPNQKYGPFSENVAGAIQKLHKGETSPLIVDDSGYHIARYIDEKAPLNVSFAEARADLLSKYHPVWRQRRFFEFTGAMDAQHGVQIFNDRVLSTGAAAP